MSHYRTTLNPEREAVPGAADSEVPYWWVEENRIVDVTDTRETVITLPRKPKRVTIQHLTNGEATLVIGGLNTTTAAITGPIEAIRALQRSILT